MPLYAARIIESSILVGIFYAENARELQDLIDEVCAPSICEFSEMPAGGIYIASNDAPALPFEEDEERRFNFAEKVSALELTISIEGELYKNDLVWTSLDPQREHLGSNIDKLLETKEGREKLEKILKEKGALSLK